MELIITFRKLIWHYWPRLSLAFFCFFLFVSTKILFMPLIKDFYGDIAQGNTRNFIIRVIEGFALLVVHCLSMYGKDFNMSYVAQRMIMKIRIKIYEQLQRLSMDFFNKWKSGEIISRMTQDLSILETGFRSTLIEIPTHIFTLIGVLIYMTILNWQMLLAFFLLAPAIVWISKYYGELTQRISTQLQRKTGDIFSQIQETLYGISVIKAFGQERAEEERFRLENERGFAFTVSGLRISSFQHPLNLFLQMSIVLVLIGLGGIQILNSQLRAEEFFAFITGFAFLVEPLNSLSREYLVKQKSLGSIKRVQELLEQVSSVKETTTPVELNKVEGDLEFKNIWFQYSAKQDWVLQDVSFKLPRDSILAIVGPSGSGKTTLVNLIPRFFELQRGEILLDDVPIQNLSLETLREQLGIVTQETILFSGSIRDNIAYGNPKATEEQVIAAARAANAADFIEGFPSKYHTLVGDRGVRLSGGQKQRISIARALLKNPRILILDEATSALDSESERLVQGALEHLMQGRTTIVIAHRLSTITKANQIVVLDNGKVNAIGTHATLLKDNHLYQTLYQNQFNAVTSDP